MPRERGQPCACMCMLSMTPDIVVGHRGLSGIVQRKSRLTSKARRVARLEPRGLTHGPHERAQHAIIDDVLPARRPAQLARHSERPTELRRRLVARNQPRHRDGDEGRDLAEQPLLQAEGCKSSVESLPHDPLRAQDRARQVE